ncbi:MAG: hypothetical protein ACC662_08935, partial [Planctomycetota bacterium]
MRIPLRPHRPRALVVTLLGSALLGSALLVGGCGKKEEAAQPFAGTAPGSALAETPEEAPAPVAPATPAEPSP